MNRRRFLGLTAATFGALLAPFRSGESRGLKPWKTLPDARPRVRTNIVPLSSGWYRVTVAPGGPIRVGDPLEISEDGRLAPTTRLPVRQEARFMAIENAPASDRDRTVLVGLCG